MEWCKRRPAQTESAAICDHRVLNTLDGLHDREAAVWARAIPGFHAHVHDGVGREEDLGATVYTH
jgi:hypothetical protein